jgi:H+/Cl- antiporter ClcA
VFALGLIAKERYLAAGAAASVAFLYQAPTTLPFWGLALLLIIARRMRWTILAPLAIAGAVLAILAQFQPPGVETVSMLRRLDPMQEELQRMRAGYSFVSTWILNQGLDFAIQAAIAALAFWRLQKNI